MNSTYEIMVSWDRMLCFANAGVLDAGNIYAMDIAVRTLPSDSPAVEIGSFCGLSVNAMFKKLA